MKIALGSDLHLEFGDIRLENTEKADVLILSGDILIASVLYEHPDVTTLVQHEIMDTLGPQQKLALRFRNFMEACAENFPQVVYVAGNHEFYHGKWAKTVEILRAEADRYSNFHYLERDMWKHQGINFIGGTLWTDLNNNDPLTAFHLSDMMNDYRQILNDELGFVKLRPVNTMERHKQTLEYIQKVVDKRKDEKFVVVGHHCPSKKSTKPGYENDYLMNGGYSSNLEEFILDRPQIKAWTHGHTHNPFDYMIGETRILCNPRGYAGYEATAEDFKLKYFEV